MFKKYLFFLLITFFPLSAFGSMTSTNFTIFADSINVGGAHSSVGDYVLTDTIGELATGISASSGIYEIKAGFQAMDLENGPLLSLTITGLDDLNLATLSTSSISSASTTVNISTDLTNGCTLKISSVSGDSFGSLSGDVSIGEEEIGFSVNGGPDLPLLANQTLYNLNSPSLSTDVDLNLRASISEFSTYGNYSQTVTLLLIANP
ncbi:MAG: hypothetical protein WC414_01380 [Patescibacteria group bacterium]